MYITYIYSVYYIYIAGSWVSNLMIYIYMVIYDLHVENYGRDSFHITGSQGRLNL
jgi:hypothetical protein